MALQLWGIVCYFCLSLSGFEGLWGLQLSGGVNYFCLSDSLGRRLSDIFCFRLCFLFERRRVLRLQRSGILCSFLVCSLQASIDSRAPAVRYCLFFLFVLSGPRRILGLRLSGAFFVESFYASRDSGPPEFRYFLLLATSFWASWDSVA